MYSLHPHGHRILDIICLLHDDDSLASDILSMSLFHSSMPRDLLAKRGLGLVKLIVEYSAY